MTPPTSTTKGRDQSVNQNHQSKVQNGKVKKKKDCCLQDHQCDVTVIIEGEDGVYHCIRKRGHKKSDHKIVRTY